MAVLRPPIPPPMIAMSGIRERIGGRGEKGKRGKGEEGKRRRGIFFLPYSPFSLFPSSPGSVTPT